MKQKRDGGATQFATPVCMTADGASQTNDSQVPAATSRNFERPVNSRIAGQFLNLHPKTLEHKARTGEIPAHPIRCQQRSKWLMRHYIRPVAERVGISKKIDWHTFRRTFTTLLQANGENVKVVQELLRHSSTKTTLDTYAQAVTPAKRAAQKRIVQMFVGEASGRGRRVVNA